VEPPETPLDRISVHIFDVIENEIIGPRQWDKGAGIKHGEIRHPRTMLRGDYEIIQSVERGKQPGESIEGVMDGHADVAFENEMSETWEIA
jgi:hypothetical protein